MSSSVLKCISPIRSMIFRKYIMKEDQKGLLIKLNIRISESLIWLRPASPLETFIPTFPSHENVPSCLPLVTLSSPNTDTITDSGQKLLPVFHARLSAVCLFHFALNNELSRVRVGAALVSVLHCYLCDDVFKRAIFECNGLSYNLELCRGIRALSVFRKIY